MGSQVHYDKLSLKIPSYLMKVPYECHKFNLSFCESQANEVLSILWFVMNSPLFSTIPP